jgi:outer membrane protein assembly factor BamB
MLRTLSIFALLLSTLSADNPVGWRTDSTGKYHNANPVLKWSVDSNIKWKTATPDWSNALPVVVGEKVFICSEPADLICIDKNNGKVLWKKSFITKEDEEGKAPRAHNVTGYSSPTPVSNGKNIFVVSGYGTVACFDMEGNQSWLKKINPPKHKWGTCVSPIIVNEKLIVHISPNVTALSLKDGNQLWQIDSKGTWGTPLIVPVGEETALYLNSGDFINSANGELISKNIRLPWTSPVSDGKAIYIIDFKEACALEIPKKLSKGQPLKKLWSLASEGSRKNRYYASPIVHEGLIYAITRKGHFFAVDTSKGELAYSKDLNMGGTTYPSLFLAGKNLFVSSDTGKTTIIETGKSYKEIAMNSIEKFRSTPIIDGDKIYIRSLTNLYCIGK